MTSRPFLRLLLIVTGMAACEIPPAAGAPPSAAYLSPEHGSSAVDLRGTTYHGTTYGRRVPPWLGDRIRAVAPKYPREDRRRRNEGRGVYELHLNLQTGRVARVVIAQSTGFRSLDAAAIEALQKWQWKPGRWKQINMPVTFTMAHAHEQPPVGSIPVPPW